MYLWITARTTVRNASLHIYGITPKKLQTTGLIQEAYELFILLYNTRTDNEFLPATAHILYLTFHLYSHSGPNYRFSLYENTVKQLFILYNKLENIKYANIFV